MEILHLRGSEENKNSVPSTSHDPNKGHPRHSRKKCKSNTNSSGLQDNEVQLETGPDTEIKLQDCARAMSDEEDSWSEPGNVRYSSTHHFAYIIRAI